MERSLLCRVRVTYDEPPHRIGNRVRGERCGGSYNILFSAAPAAAQEFAHKLAAELLAACGFRRLSPEKIAAHYYANDFLQHFPGGCDLSSAIEWLTEQLLRNGVD